jgi:hypothetical protein
VRFLIRELHGRSTSASLIAFRMFMIAVAVMIVVTSSRGGSEDDKDPPGANKPVEAGWVQ